MPYIWFWVHWLREHSPTSGKYQFTKNGRLARDPKEGAKIILKFLFVTWKWAFQKKAKSNTERRKKAKKSYIWFWVHWLPEHAPTSAKYQFTEYGLPTARDPSERAKIHFEVTLSKSKTIFNKKTQEHYASDKIDKNDLCLSLDELVGRAKPKYWFTKFIWLTVRDHRKGAKIILKLLCLSRRRVLIKNQRALSNKGNLQKLVAFYSGCADWQFTPRNMLEIT